ncbi:MAG: DUF3794 domain-containing protein [Tissierellia bacterium]|nr:DUF3794 domain-containing protein [Tissierellia bacterium]
MEIIRDILKVEELKGYEEIESLIETDLYLNQTNPDVEKILWTDGKIEILNTKIIKDKILVNGLIKFKVAYKSNEEKLNIHLLETNRDFREEIEIEGITEDMSVELISKLEYIEGEITDERKLSLRALVKLEGIVEQINLIEVIKDIKEVPNLQVLKEKIKYNNIKDKIESYGFVKEAFEIGEDEPSMEEILKIQIMAHEKELNISQDRIIVSGIAETSIIYYGGGKINSIIKEIPFTHFIEMYNIDEDYKCQINMEVVDGQYELRENLEGDIKIVDLEMKVKILVKVYNIEEKEIIVDAYSTSKKIELEKEEITIIENIDDLINRESISKELNNKDIKEVYAIEGEANIIDSQYVEDKVIIEGLISLNIYYLKEETEEIATMKEEIPFKSYLTIEELSNSPIVNVDISLEEIKYNLKNNTLKIDGSVKNHISVDKETKIDILTEIEETDIIIDKKNRPSIIIYMVQKEDKLWDIAKRYNTTMEEIILTNDISSPSTLMQGEKIIIEKKVDIDF